MRISKVSVAVLVACVGLLAARSSDLREYGGEEFTPDKGLVVLRVVREKSSKGSTNLSMTREEKDLSAVIVSVEGKQKFQVNEIDTMRGFLLPAGRWYVEQLRIGRDRDLPKLVRKEQAKLRSFEVIGGAINYAGLYSVQFPLDVEGRMSVEYNIDLGPDLVKEAAEAFPTAFQALQLLYCPAGRKCKPPNEL